MVKLEPDPKIAEVSADLASELVNAAAKNFATTLDYSDASIERVEALMDRWYREKPSNPPDPAVIERALIGMSQVQGVQER